MKKEIFDLLVLFRARICVQWFGCRTFRRAFALLQTPLAGNTCSISVISCFMVLMDAIYDFFAENCKKNKHLLSVSKHLFYSSFTFRKNRAYI